MRERMSSYQLMNILDKAEDEMETLRSDVNSMRTELSTELSVFSNAMEFASSSIGKFNEYILQQDGGGTTTTVLSKTEILDGNCEKYGLSAYPVCRNVPTNIFNFQAATGPIFKNNANIYIGGKSAATYLPMLMHDSIKGKGSAFGEMNTDTITLRIEVNPNDVFGSTLCNSIELLPFIPGSFDITQIRLFDMTDYRKKATASQRIISKTIPNVGAQRILLLDSKGKQKEIELYACEFDLKLKFKNNAGKYPFGFRHIYFLDGNYDSGSTILFRVKKYNYIDWISDSITIHDQDGLRQTTCTEEGIKLYANYSYGILSGEISPSKGVIQNVISRNIREFYVQMPITKSVVSIKFKNICER